MKSKDFVAWTNRVCILHSDEDVDMGEGPNVREIRTAGDRPEP